MRVRKEYSEEENGTPTMSVYGSKWAATVGAEEYTVTVLSRALTIVCFPNIGGDGR